MSIGKLLQYRDRIQKLQEKEAELNVTIETLTREEKDLKDSIAELTSRQALLPSKHEKEQQKREKEQAGIVAEIETLNRKLSTETEKLEAIKTDIRSASRILTAFHAEKKDIERDIKKLKDEREEVTADLNKKKGKVEKTNAAEKAELDALNASIATAKQVLADTTAETDRKTALIEEEKRALISRRIDLEIYEVRLRKKYPDAKIILKPLPTPNTN